NTLVGFATRADVGAALAQQPVRGGASQGRMVEMAMENGAAELEAFEREADDAARLFTRFQALQRLAQGPAYVHDADPVRRDLRRRLRDLAERADRLLAPQYGVQPAQARAYQQWRDSHQPFHWFTEFYGIMSRGGFDVIIGNPPYVEYSKVKRQYTIQGYETESCGNLYAYTLDRCARLSSKGSYFGMIMPASAFSTDRMQPLMELLQRTRYWISFYDFRPSKLFDGVNLRLSIAIIQFGDTANPQTCAFSTDYNRWYTVERPRLFACLQYAPTEHQDGTVPKVGQSLERSIFVKTDCSGIVLGRLLTRDGAFVLYFHDAILYWIRATDFAPELDGYVSSHVKSLSFADQTHQLVASSLLNSSIFYWRWTKTSNCRDLSLREIRAAAIPETLLSESALLRLRDLNTRLMDDLMANSQVKTRHQRLTGPVRYREFNPVLSKPIINEIDHVLARHYGFTDEELDYIINYDIKYRMGDALNDDEDGD
ncbi:MAG: SAM-dependent methyltransferase, partial [Chloroflexi bacterium]|nr:SAM-dependent methyltransferase [Chloroflexota bacterium]